MPRRPDFSLDLPGIRAAVAERHPKVLFLATPNNPDGSLLPPAVIDELLDLPLLVVIGRSLHRVQPGQAAGWANA